MSSQSNSTCSADGDCLLLQLKAIQKRTMSYKQYLSNPHLTPFLTTNDPLYPASYLSVAPRPTQTTADADLSSLDHIILDLENILEGAKETREGILVAKSQIQTIFHPVRSLPDDILLLVFRWCTLYYENEEEWHDYGSLDCEYPSWQLSYVCRRWRRLALASPRLWSIVRISPREPHGPQAREHAIVSRLDLYLKRSRNALLSVTIGNSPSDYCASVLKKGDLLSLLRSTTARWESLSMSACAGGGISDDDSVFWSCSFPNLKSLEVLDDNEHLYRNAVVLTAFRIAPNLVHIRSYDIKLDIDWENIISYRTCIDRLPRHSLSKLSLLQQLTLDELHTSADRSLTSFYDRLPHISLPTLHTLRVTLSYDVDVNIFDHMSMPCLQSLEITHSFSQTVDYPDMRRFQHLLNLSISISDILADVQSIVPFFAGCPHVTSLHLGDSTFLRLLPIDGTDDLFPCLERLILNPSGWFSVAHTDVLAIIESRLNVPLPKLKEFRIDMQHCHAAGTYFSVSTFPYYHSRRQTDWETTFQRIRSLGVKVVSTNAEIDF